MFMTVSGIHCNFFIFSPIRLKTCRSNVFFFFIRQNVSAREIGRVAKVFRARWASGAQFVQTCSKYNVIFKELFILIKL